MGRFGSFLLGLIVGAVGVYGAQHYHVVRADDGVHLVPKVAVSFADVYVDIREFNVTDWDNHRSLALAIVNAKKEGLFKDSASNELRRSLDSAMDVLTDRAL